MKRILVAALALAALAGGTARADSTPPQGQALYPETVPQTSGVLAAQATIQRFVRADGAVGTARLHLNLRSGPGHKLVYFDPARGLLFTALHVTTVRFAPHAARLSGTGVVNGRRVHFTAVAVDGARDVFRIDWGRGASRGGLVAGDVVVV